MSKNFFITIVLALILYAPQSFAASTLNPEMTALMDSLLAEAKAADTSFDGFSAADGEELFRSKRMHSKKGEERGCTTCHTKNPADSGKTPVGKVIEPISPAVNSERLTEPKHVKKWFKRNCKWVLERECTPAEKGNFITFMLSL